MPLFVLSYRSYQYENTGYILVVLLTERKMELPIDFEVWQPILHLALPEYVNGPKNRLQRVRDFARNRLQINSVRSKLGFDQKATTISFKESDAVWLQPRRSKRLSASSSRWFENKKQLFLVHLQKRLSISSRFSL